MTAKWVASPLPLPPPRRNSGSGRRWPAFFLILWNVPRKQLALFAATLRVAGSRRREPYCKAVVGHTTKEDVSYELPARE
jgi:hypothetical protein